MIEYGERIYGERYRVESTLGAGAMGVVYAARDLALGRRVAIKVLQRGGGATRGADRMRTSATTIESLDERRARRGSERALREARALARLSHPNIVEVFDVGPCPEGLFIAMELVEGQTLREWMEHKERRWQAVLRLLVAAADALAAAHARGVIHRDFKPDNVMVDGRRLKVLDFGLARHDDRRLTTDGAVRHDGVRDQLTRTGYVLGTPAYLAPECQRGAVADARSDQYGFFVTLFESLCGRRPFVGLSLHELLDAKMQGLSVDRTDWPRLPRWLRGAIARGLAPDPAARFDSMEAVAHHLRRGLRRRKSGLAILGGAALGATAFAVLSTTPDACPDSSEHLGSVWSRSRRGEIARVLHDRAPQRAEELLAIVDDYAQQWAEAHAELCMIGPDDPRTHDAVRACLLERRAALDQFVALLAESTADLSMDALPPVQSCSEGTPTSDSELEDDQELNELLARADVLFRSGRHHALRGFAGSIAERARATDAPRIAGAARLYEGLAAASLDDYEGADRALRDAYNLALRSGYDQLAADAATRLVDVWSYGMARPDEGLAWARHAETALVRAGADPETDNLLQGALGQAYYAMGRHAEAIEHYERALASSDDEVTLSTDHINLANALGDLERFEEAASHYREAVESLARIQGDAHPSTLTARLDLVASLLDSKKPEEALALLDTVDGHMRGEDVQAELRAMALSTRAAALQQLGDDQAALPALVECARITEAAMGPQHPNTAVALANIGVAFERLGECSEALEHAVRARTIFEGASQYSSRPYAYVRHNAAAALRCLDRDAEAARELTAAIEELERINPSSADLESWRRTLADDLEAARATKAAG